MTPSRAAQEEPTSPRSDLTSLAAEILRFTGGCEKPHRNGERNPHVHIEVTHRWGQRLAVIARSLSFDEVPAARIIRQVRAAIHGEREAAAATPSRHHILTDEQRQRIKAAATSSLDTSRTFTTNEIIDWPKRWTADDIAWVKRQIIGEYRREAAAATPSLDPEKLTRAMSVSLDIYGWDLDEMAVEIVREYARLDEGSATPTHYGYDPGRPEGDWTVDLSGSATPEQSR